MRPALALALVVACRAAFPVAAAAAEESFDFNFEGIEIRNLAKLVGDITKKRFVIGDAGDDRVTLVTPTNITVAEVYPLFISALASRGYSVVEAANAYRIVSVQPRTAPSAAVFGPGEAVPEQGVVTKIFRLEHIAVADLANVLVPMMGPAGKSQVGTIEASNHIIVTDTAENIRRVGKIVAEIDTAGKAHTTQIHPLQFARAEDVARELMTAIVGAESGGREIINRLPKRAGSTASLGHNTVVVPSPHSNSLIFVGPPTRIAELKRIVALMDVESPSGAGRLNVVFLQYIGAEEAAKNLNALLERSGGKQPPAIAIQASVENSALLIDASPRDYDMVKRLVGELDTPPKQVLIEVVIAEVTETEGMDIGVDIAAGGIPDAGENIPIGAVGLEEGSQSLIADIVQGIAPNGLTIGIAKGSFTDAQGNVVPRVPALLHIGAVRTDSRLNILSDVPLWAQNNKEATVNIVKNIPILRSTIAGGTGSARDVIQNIERIDVGIKLKVTPHINPNNEVLLQLNPSIEAIIDEGSAETAFTPTIARRDVKTTITVPDNETVVISGLIRDDQLKRVRKIPLLGDIPGLGFFFRKTVTVKEKTNLLVFISPHIVKGPEVAQELRRMLESKTGITSSALLSPDDEVERE